MTSGLSINPEVLVDKRLPFLILLFDVFILTPLFGFVDQISLLDAFYYTFITLTTVGFGDITPATASGRIIILILILSTILVIASLILKVIYYIKLGRIIKERELPTDTKISS